MRKSILFSILSGLLLILAFPEFDYEILAWFALVPLLFAVKNSRYPFLLGYLFGLVFFGGTLFWLTNVTKIGFLLLILYLSLYPALFTFFIVKWKFPGKFFFGASLWILLEYIVSHLLTGFPWLLLGYSQYKNLRLIQISSIFGVYVVSGLVVLINTSISELFVKRRRVSIALSFLLLAIAFVYGYCKLHPHHTSPVKGEGLSVSIIQGNIPSLQRWEPGSKETNLKAYLNLTKKAAKSKPEFVIWPESAISTYLSLDEPIQKTLFELTKRENFYLLSGSLDKKKGKDFNSAFLISLQGKIVQSYDKVHLVPCGEYIPGRRFPPFKKFVTKAAGFIPNFNPGENFTIFSLPMGLSQHYSETAPKSNFAALICFEDIFPELSRRFTRKGANFLVNITNDSWFGNGSGPYQHFAACVFRAVENRRYLLRAANTGVSAVIAPSGKILKRVEENGQDLFVPGYLNEEIYPSSALGFYTKFGDAPLMLFCLVFLVLLPLVRRQRRNDKKIGECERVLNYRFKDKALLKEALTHSSFAYENALSSNERMEFLGDTILEVVVSDILYKRYLKADEGELTEKRAFLVNGKHLASIARKLSLGKFLLLGKGEGAQGGSKLPSNLANGLEAIIGAIYLDGGMRAATRFIKRQLLL